MLKVIAASLFVRSAVSFRQRVSVAREGIRFERAITSLPYSGQHVCGAFEKRASGMSTASSQLGQEASAESRRRRRRRPQQPLVYPLSAVVEEDAGEAPRENSVCTSVVDVSSTASTSNQQVRHEKNSTRQSVLQNSSECTLLSTGPTASTCCHVAC